VTDVHLGRPWRAYAMTLFINCQLPEGIQPTGWDNWRNKENEKTARYMEYNNTGKGAATKRRASWAKVLTPDEAHLSFSDSFIQAGFNIASIGNQVK